MVYDVVGPHFFSVHPNSKPVGGCSSFPTDGTGVSPSSYGYDVSRLSDRFLDVICAADQPLYNGCDESQLLVVARLVNIKAENNKFEICYDQVSQWASDMLPRDHTLPSDYYHKKKLIRDLDLPVEKIYASTAEHMTWHACHQTTEGSMCHPSNTEAWRHFDQSYPNFAMEPRNVRLALCTNGFTPHGQYGRTYSCWLVILTPYILPPRMCMKPEYMFLTIVIPGPSNPKRRIDVYLEPLIEELLQFLHIGVLMHDHATNQRFMMRAVLMWTVNNLPIYGMASGWSTAGSPYWNTHLIQHNLDVMHTEKNVFDNIFNIVMDVKWKKKDNLNAHKDLKNICNRLKLEVDKHRPNAMPKAAYILTKEQKKKICEWLRGLRFPDGYAFSITRWVDIANLRLHDMKSHDCYVFM
ncbi:UNVERIFIED_CONTAM: hypothetical protein Scaly_2590300 [Sesamum calycinum]|uniref:Uncharacterized protein n=1 Tax=Sesamum calycinum TaxID=2727403 RepID=A0AAW2JCW1_9LAMI